jgi:hypothetical protein
MPKFASLLVGISLIFGLGFCKSPINVSVDKSKVKTGEVFTYTINIEGEFSSPQIDLPEFGNLKIVSQSQSKNYIFKSDAIIVKTTLSYKLMAYKPGTYIIDSVTIEDKGRVFKSESVTVEVRGQPLEEKEERDELFEGAITL